MATNQAGAGAALSFLGQAVPRIADETFEDIRAEKKLKLEEEERKRLKKLQDLQLLGVEQNLATGEINLDVARRKQGIIKNGDMAIDEVHAALKSKKDIKEAKIELRKKVDATILSPKEKGFIDLGKAATDDVGIEEDVNINESDDQTIVNSRIGQFRKTNPRVESMLSGAEGRLGATAKAEGVKTLAGAKVDAATTAFDRSKELQDIKHGQAKELKNMSISEARAIASNAKTAKDKAFSLQVGKDINGQIRYHTAQNKKVIDLAGSLATLDELMENAGGIYGTDSLAVAGLGSKATRDWLQGTSSEIRVILNQIYALKLNILSGAQVSDKEFKRFERAMGTGNRDSEASFRISLQNMVEQTYRALADGEKALYGPSAQVFRDRGVSSARMLNFLPADKQDKWINSPLEDDYQPTNPLGSLTREQFDEWVEADKDGKGEEYLQNLGNGAGSQDEGGVQGASFKVGEYSVKVKG